MLEFYQAYSDYQDLMTMTEEMIAFVATSATGKDEVPFEGADDFAARAVRPRVAAAGGCRCRVEEARAAGCRDPTCAITRR